MIQPLIKTEIRGREIIFYLTSKSDLEAIKSKNIYADIFLVLFSLTAGGLISVYLTKEFSSNLSSEILSRLGIFATILGFVAAAFFIFYLLYTIQSFRSINNIIASGRVTSFNVDTKETVEDIKATDGVGLQIMEALYYTDKISVDVTKELQSHIKENTLMTLANNDLAGDPHPGSPKKLRLKYSFNHIVYVKEYGEGDPIKLP